MMGLADLNAPFHGFVDAVTTAGRSGPA